MEPKIVADNRSFNLYSEAQGVWFLTELSGEIKKKLLRWAGEKTRAKKNLQWSLRMGKYNKKMMAWLTELCLSRKYNFPPL